MSGSAAMASRGAAGQQGASAPMHAPDSPMQLTSPHRAHKSRLPAVLLAGGSLLLISLLFAASRGAFAIAPLDLWQLLLRGMPESTTADAAATVFWHIRLPRLVLAVAAGAGLGVAGCLMQGLFRNPLADPGLVGVSSGAALAAAITIVAGSLWLPELPRQLGSWALVVMAFGGGLAVTALIYALAQTPTGTQVALMLLAGVAINALAGAALGYLSYIATDEQLRSLQFWMLGSLGGARWSAVGLVAAVSAAGLLLACWLARPLNALALGEAQASLLGVRVEALKRTAIVACALMVGAVTATTGVIGFIGLVAPHMVRLAFGADHRLVVPGSALLGASLVLLADALARTLAAPAELPLGVLTAALGAPFFLLLLRAMRKRLATA